MIQLEDQTFPKRCGHLDGKSVVPAAEMCGKLRAALDARRSGDTLILARTDAVAVEGLDAALERAEAYLDCGVDALFIEALRTPRADGRGLRALRASACRCWPTWSKAARRRCRAPTSSAQRGFRIVIFPGGTARAVAHTLQGYYASLQAARHDRAVARPDARLRRPQRGDRHAGAAGGGAPVRVSRAYVDWIGKRVADSCQPRRDGHGSRLTSQRWHARIPLRFALTETSRRAGVVGQAEHARPKAGACALAAGQACSHQPIVLERNSVRRKMRLAPPHCGPHMSTVPRQTCGSTFGRARA